MNLRHIRKDEGAFLLQDLQQITGCQQRRFCPFRITADLFFAEAGNNRIIKFVTLVERLEDGALVVQVVDEAHVDNRQRFPFGDGDRDSVGKIAVDAHRLDPGVLKELLAHALEVHAQQILARGYAGQPQYLVTGQAFCAGYLDVFKAEKGDRAKGAVGAE